MFHIIQMMETSLQPTVGKMRQMKKSKLQAAETRRRIVNAAAALTHGRFCGHFSSKDQLVAEACGAGMNSIVEMVEAAACLSGGRVWLDAIAASYLSTHH